MSVIAKLASSLNRKDEVPNIELAVQIASKKDQAAVKELVTHLSDKNKDIQSDCIKVLYEIGDLKPALIAGYITEFVLLLTSKNNRLQWGAMTALSAIASEYPKEIYKELGKILDAADKGSVITKDNAVAILIKLYKLSEYTNKVFPLLTEQLKSSPTNQLPMYAENAAPAISNKHKAEFIDVLHSRLDEIEKDSKRKRVEKVIKKLTVNS
ncbi:HEAT repeat domain-containing protein [Taibaiella soli]|uniref:HEAT repeat domain-containing protein n=1 Tax=Taibaiella soli TaxID=1649169 RepID=A0A2W2ABD4_9BACT|nr:hypothetical protein [Taibaiella soli]PZF72725.1 hypothetical protein DN068_12755 [Taibaiella soli]